MTQLPQRPFSCPQHSTSSSGDPHALPRLDFLQGNAAKQTVQLAFGKIRGLQLELEERCGEVKSLEAQLDAQQDIAAQLSAELEGKVAELSKVAVGGCCLPACWQCIASLPPACLSAWQV